MPTYVTRFGALDQYEKGSVEIIDDDPRRYTFSNVFDVAAHSRPYEKVAVGKNRQYVLEAIRAEGESEWRSTAHDEFALVMPQTDRAGARDVVERFQQHLAEVPGVGNPDVEVSIGVAQWDEGMTLDGLAAAADAELYEAKRSRAHAGQK